MISFYQYRNAILKIKMKRGELNFRLISVDLSRNFKCISISAKIYSAKYLNIEA